MLTPGAYRSRGVLLADIHSFRERLNVGSMWNGWKLKYGIHFRYASACLNLQYCRIVEERRHCAQVWCYLSLLFPLKSDIQWNDTILSAIRDPGCEFKGFQDRSASMLTGLWNGCPNIRVSILSRGEDLFIPPNLLHLPPPDFYAVVSGAISGGWERPVYAADLSTPASATVKSEWNCSSIC
jgi:hypothetical protein